MVRGKVFLRGGLDICLNCGESEVTKMIVSQSGFLAFSFWVFFIMIDHILNHAPPPPPF